MNMLILRLYLDEIEEMDKNIDTDQPKEARVGIIL